MKSIVKKLVRDEKGAALIMALILLLIGGLISAALLNYMGSGILAGEVHERRTAELYAADAGVEDAIWRLPSLGLCLYQSTNYTITDMNDKTVQVFIDFPEPGIYKVTSIAITDGDGDGGVAAIDSATAVEAYIEAMAFDLLGGALVSMSNIDFSKDCIVIGDIYYVGEITGSDYTHTEGEEIQVPLSAFPTQEQNEAFAQQFKDEALLGGTHTGTMTINADTILPATYITGDLFIQKHGNDGVTVTLTGPIYVEGAVDVDMLSSITGSGSIVAVGDIGLAKLPNYGIEGDSIIMSLNGDITFKKEATIEALVYAPNGSVNVDKELTVEGSIIGGYINIKKDAYLNYVSKSSSFEFPPVVTYAAKIKTYNIIQS
jgi:Flp pilus assembly pilin Flp